MLPVSCSLVLFIGISNLLDKKVRKKSFSAFDIFVIHKSKDFGVRSQILLHGSPPPFIFLQKIGIFWTKRAKNGWMLFVKIVALCCYNLLNWSVLETYWILLVFVKIWFNLVILLADIPRKMSFLSGIHETYWNASLSWESQSELANAEGDTASNLLQTLEHIRNIFSHNTEYLSSGNIFSQQILAKSAPIAREDTQVGSTLEQKQLWPKNSNWDTTRA